MCADGTAALTCNVDPSDAFVTVDGKLFFLEHGRIRTLDENGNVKTVYGQGYSFGDGGSATSARFGTMGSLGQYNDGKDKIVVLDAFEKRFREFAIGETITTIAGTGRNATPVVGAAAGQPLYTSAAGAYWAHFAVDAANGDIFFQRAEAKLAKLVRSSGNWVDLVGGGATSYASPTSDGLTGANIDFNSNYPGLVLGMDATNTKMLVAKHSYDYAAQKYTHAFLKTYQKADGTQAHIAGKAGTIDTAPCTIGSDVTACTLFDLQTLTNAVHDSAGSRWLVGRKTIP